MEVLDDDLGILWKEPSGGRVLFAWRSGEWACPADGNVREMVENAAVINTGGQFPVKKFGIYLIL
jgi:hypothetical protein